MYTESELKKILVIDIETTSNYINYEEYSEDKPGETKFWQKKASRSVINLTEAIFYIGQLMVRKRTTKFYFALKPMPCARAG